VELAVLLRATPAEIRGLSNVELATVAAVLQERGAE
jgi:hypothetical protein